VLNKFAPGGYVLMHPDDVLKYGFTDGDYVTLQSRQGSLHTVIVSSNEVLEGELFMPWHFSDMPVNNLTRDELDPFSKIAPFKLTACKVVKR